MSVFIGYPSFMAYQMMKGKKDNNDGFPTIPGTIARYSALGLTNEHMKENPVWVDKTGNGHDLQMKNFAWGGMSGVGGYVGDFSRWVNNRDTTEIGITKSNSKVIIDVKVSQGSGKHIVYISKSNLGISNNNVTIKITSTYPEGVMKFANSASNKYLKLPSNGIITLQDNPEYTSNEMYLHLASADLGQITIEQLPLYPGFILGDGIDDFAVTEKELNFEDTYTVYTPLILLKYGGAVSGKSSAKDFSLITSTSSKSIGFDSANVWSGSIPVDLFEFALVVCKRDPKTMYIKDLITGKTNQNNSKEFVPNPGKYFIWRNTGGSWCQVAIAGQIICNGYFSTDEDDEKVLDWYKKQYPWLFPDQAWTTVGKTNEDEDRATIANITGNGNDLVLSNFGFSENSGYGLYFFSSFHSNLNTTANYTHIGYNQITLHNVKTEISSVHTFLKSVSAEQKIDYTIKISGLTALNEANPGFKIKNSQHRAGFALDVSSDGIYHIQGTVQESDYKYVTCTLAYGNGNIPTDLDLNVTIEQIPEYEGYLVTDGVDDKITSSVFTMGKDFTIVGEWKFLKEDVIKLAGFTKYDAFRFHNYSYYNRINIYIYSPQGVAFNNVDTIKAVTSEGQVYFDFNSIKEVKPGDLADKGYVMNIGHNGSNHTKLALKNFAIYPTVLSKDDCIKAYNYLQTLKAK